MFIPLCPHLRRFLLERRLYFRFMLNVILGADSIKDYIRIRKGLSLVSPHAIAFAFDWINSIEGFDYWTTIDRKWEIKYAFLLSGDIIKPFDSDPTVTE